MKKEKIIIIVSIIIFLSLTILILINLRNVKSKADYIVHYHTDSYIYDLSIKKSKIYVNKNEIVTCVKAPCDPVKVDSFKTKYKKEYQSFIEGLFENKSDKEITLSNSDLSNEENEIISNIIKEQIKNNDDKWQEIKISDDDYYYGTQIINIDLNNDGNSEIVKLDEDQKIIEINDIKYLNNKEENVYSYQYIVLDINLDGNKEIIQREMYGLESPLQSEYTIYKYDEEDLIEIGNFEIIGNLPEVIYFDGDSIKFEYWPYETPDDFTMQEIVTLSK